MLDALLNHESTEPLEMVIDCHRRVKWEDMVEPPSQNLLASLQGNLFSWKSGFGKFTVDCVQLLFHPFSLLLNVPCNCEELLTDKVKPSLLGLWCKQLEADLTIWTLLEIIERQLSHSAIPLSSDDQECEEQSKELLNSELFNKVFLVSVVGVTSFSYLIDAFHEVLVANQVFEIRLPLDIDSHSITTDLATHLVHHLDGIQFAVANFERLHPVNDICGVLSYVILCEEFHTTILEHLANSFEVSQHSSLTAFAPATISEDLSGKSCRLKITQSLKPNPKLLLLCVLPHLAQLELSALQ